MFIKGFTYGYQAKRGAYRTERAIDSQDRLFDIGVNWMCLAFPIMQEKYNSTKILYDYRNTITDKDITFAINRAHERGVKVCLKPMINSKDGIWRALIDFPDSDMWDRDIYWGEWFEHYTAFMVHYAELAEETGCEMLCIGCEMSGTERKESYWRELIKQVKEVYSGSLVYNTNHGRENTVAWFDSVDYIGTSAYFKVGKVPGDSKENMVNEWKKVAVEMKKLSEKLGKQVIFMEIGCRSAKGCAMMPWDFTHTEFERSEDEQANFYDSCLTALYDEEWFAGAFWWDWSTEIYSTKEEASKDEGFNIHMKKAEDILREWYKK